MTTARDTYQVTREHAECDGKRRCMYCVEQESYPELEEAGLQPWPKENPAVR